MLYMIIERFKDRNAVPVYRRFRDQGRLAPDGLTYLSSWVTTARGPQASRDVAPSWSM